MTMSKRYSLYHKINKHVGWKLMAAIFVVAAVFIPATSYLSYQYTFIQEQTAYQERIQRLVKMVRYNASMAAYLKDNDLASEVVSALYDNPEIEAVRFHIADGSSVDAGSAPASKSHITEVLTPPFSAAEVGKIELYLDYGYINSHARDKGISLVMWQTSLLLLILLCVYIIVRQVVTKPLYLLLEQIRTTPVDGVRTGDEIRIQSNDEIGFLAENTNNLLKRIADFYRSEAKNNQHILKLERQFRIIFEHSHAGILLLDENNQVHLANPSVKSMLQCKPGSDWHSSFASLFDDKSQFEATLQQVREEGISLFKDFRLRDNDDVWLRVLFSNVENVHNLDLEKFVELVIYDISDRAQKEKTFAYNATHDALTGIFNRRGAEVRFNELCNNAKAFGSHLVMIWLDLNDFKIVNDEHGHEAGDIVLKELSSRLRSVSRPDDIIARWGGDEFVVAVELKDLTVLPHILSDMEDAFSTSIEINDDLKVTVGASIGVSTSHSFGYDVEKLLIKADQMMYRVKKDGKNGYRIDG